MNYTTNLNLKKPEYTDTADIEDLNDNFDIIDEALEAVLPEVTAADNGKFLRVVEGEWTAATVASASGGSY